MLKSGRLFKSLALALSLAACATEGVKSGEQIELISPQGPVVLEVRGAIANGNDDSDGNGNVIARFDMAMLQALPSVRLKTSTSVTDGAHLFEGVLVRDVLDRVGAKGTTVTATAPNDYAVDIPLSDFRRFDTIIAYRKDGEPLSRSDKGPLWIVYPRDEKAELQDIRYDYRWVWNLEALKVR